MRSFHGPVRGWICLLLSALLVASCGRAPSTPPMQGRDFPPDQEGIRIRDSQGQLTLPQGSRVEAGALTAVTAWGESAVAAQSPTTGNFTARVNQLAAQLFFLVDSNRRLVLMGTAQGNGSLRADSQSTAEALLFLNPAIALAAADLQVASQVFQLLRQRNLVPPVQQAVEQQLTTLGYLDPSQEPLRTAILNGWNAIYQLARSGALPAWPPGPSGASRLRSQSEKPGASRSTIQPDAEQSGLRLLAEEDSDNDERTYEMSILNYKWRFVDFYYRAFDRQNNPLGPWTYIRSIGPRDAVSLGSIVTGALYRPSQQSAVLRLPEGTAQVRIAGAGVGSLEMNPEQRQIARELGVIPFLNTLVGDLGFSVILPALIYALGIGPQFLLWGSGPDGYQEALDLFFDVTSTLLSGLSSGTQALILEGRLIPDALPEIFSGLIRVLVDTPVGARLLEFILTRLAQRGVMGVALEMLRGALRRLTPVLFLTATGELVVNVGLVVSSWASSRQVELWTAIPPNSVSWYFVVTLTWQQPTDLDLYVTAPNGETAWWGQRQISVGELDRDDIDGFGPENFTLRRKLVGTYRVAVDFYRYSDQTSGYTMPSNYRVYVTTRTREQLACRSGTLTQPGETQVACLVELDQDGRVRVRAAQQDSAAATGLPSDGARKPVGPGR